MADIEEVIALTESNQQKIEAQLDAAASFYDGSADGGYDRFGGNGEPKGYYPFLTPGGETIYVACLARQIADAAASTANARASRIGLINPIAGHLGGQTGSYALIPWLNASTAMPLLLSQQQSLSLPKTGQPKLNIYIEASDDGPYVTIGAGEAPIDPTLPDDPLDLGSGGIVYAKLGEVTPLSISIPSSIPAVEIDLPEDLDFVIVVPNTLQDQVGFAFDFAVPSNPSTPTAGPWPITGEGLAETIYLNKIGTAAGSIPFDGSNHPTSVVNGGWASAGLGLDFPRNDDPLLDQVPNRFAMEFTGIAPNVFGIICELFDYGIGIFRMICDGGRFILTLGNRSGNADVFLNFARDYEGVHSYRLEWTNDPEGEGGTAEMFVDGVSVATGDSSKKLTISPAAALYLNNSLGNFANSTAGIVYHSMSFDYDLPYIEYNYEPFTGDAIDYEDLIRLGVDGRLVTEDQPLRTISYNAAFGPTTTLDLLVGDISFPAGRAYKAVLLTYPDGVGAPPVAHPNELVMTKFTVQNARFEDAVLFQTQPSWSECVPEGAPPVVNGIVYTCDAIRIGNYVEFEFGYHLSADTNPTEPFGDLNAIDGLDTYMLPHKWEIYDQAGTLLATVAHPNGDPLNVNHDLPMWQGPWDTRNCAYTSPSSRWWPAGTIGSKVVWRSHAELEDHDREEVETRVPIPEAVVPMATHLDYSVNGFDPRLSIGANSGDGHLNGFGSWQIMPWNRTDSQTFSSTATSGDPYTGLNGPTMRKINGALWLNYTPFNIMGRSPITAPGGVRDDRQAIPDPVGAYISEPDGERAFDGRSYRQIAISYLTGYASDPFHLYEDGKCVPLYKGQANRAITMHSHYYGLGDLGTPWSRRFPLYIGRIYDWLASQNPTRVKSGGGPTQDKPWRGLFGIDRDHAHQFPGWGSMLWKTPEFAFWQCKFFDQIKLYGHEGGGILKTDTGYRENLQINVANRGAAWMFQHAAMAWKLGSSNSPRLYSQQEILDWVVDDFEYFHDNMYASTPGVLNLPAVGAVVSDFSPVMLARLVAYAQFGMVTSAGPGFGAITQQGFMQGYWICALGIGERTGSNDAIREASAEAGAVLDWLINAYRMAVCGSMSRLSSTLKNIPGSDYDYVIWTAAQVATLCPSGNDGGDPLGDYTALPSSWEELEVVNGVNPTWDVGQNDALGPMTLDSQAMSATLGAPFWLKNVLKQTGPDIDAACAIARARINEKIAQQEALGAAGGSTWFRYHQGSFTPPLPVPAE